MYDEPTVQPLPYRHRNYFFYALASIFFISLPFLFLYTTGYRYNFEDTSFISTGGLYVAVERTGAEIYIDNELVRETRAFRRAFYAQSLDPGTHRVHVQKENHHTWVKELPVYAHLVTEAQAFNLPLRPQVRVISPWRTSEGMTLLSASSTLQASTTNQYALASTTNIRTRVADVEFANLVELFATTSATTTSTGFVWANNAVSLPTILSNTNLATTATSSVETLATTTKLTADVSLYQSGEDVYISFTGERSRMPYYYCAESFDLLGTSTAPRLFENIPTQAANAAELVHPVQEVSEDSICDQTIRIDRQNQKVTAFDFYLGSADFVIMALEDGVYVTEVDDRAWQNSQPLMMGENLDVRVESGAIYLYDGGNIYQVVTEV